MSLKNGDLSGTLLPDVSVDEFEPKAGNEEDVIVVAFYLKDEDPADDLNTFIQRGFVDTLDVEVSPNTDEEGRYLVFVEMSRDELFLSKFAALLLDISNLAPDIKDWKIKTYYSGEQVFSMNDPELANYLILDSASYVPKDKFKMKEIKEGINRFFKGSLVSDLTINGNIVTLSHSNSKIVAEVVDVGEYDTVIGRNFLSESAFGVGKNSYEANVLKKMLGNCEVMSLGKYLFVSRDDTIMLLNNTQLDYGN
jgi:hypothetical protein